MLQWNNNRDLFTHVLLKGVISNNLEWLSKIFNDTKHHAASLRQPSFLSNKCIEDDTKAAARQSKNYIKKQKNIIFNMADGILTPCNVAGGSGIITCHWIRPNVRHIGILLLVSISAISLQSTCHSAPVCEILSKLDHPRQEKITSCRFPRWRISANLDFRSHLMGSLKSPCMTSYRSSIDTITLNCLFFF